MNKKLEQKRLFGQKKFELKKNEIEVFDKKINEETEYSISYLNLGVKTVKKSTKNSAFLELFFWAFFVIQFGLLVQTLIIDPQNKEMLGFWSLGAGFFLGMIFFLRWQPMKDLLYLTGGDNNLEFYQDKPNKEEVDNFVSELQSTIKQAYKKQYLKWDENSLKEQKLANLEWLKSIKILDEKEYNDLLKEIEIGSIIGFKKKG